jgi:hypothetical protein
MKYEKNTKVNRNKLIIQMREQKLTPSFEEIAKEFHITKQRAALIYKRDKDKYK